MTGKTLREGQPKTGTVTRGAGEAGGWSPTALRLVLQNIKGLEGLNKIKKREMWGPKWETLKKKG